MVEENTQEKSKVDIEGKKETEEETKKEEKEDKKEKGRADEIVKEMEMAEHNENNPLHKKEKMKPGLLTLLLVLGIIIGAIAVGYWMQNGQIGNGDKVAAKVNGEVISNEELDSAYDTLPLQIQGSVTKTSLLDQLVQASVIYQEAENQGIVVSKEEAAIQFEEIKISSGMTEEQFAASLETQGVTEEELIDQYAKQLTIQKFVEENLLSKIDITDAEVQEYYENNPDQFLLGEQVTVRHILIGDEDLSEEEQDEKAEDLLAEITEENFCEYVELYTTDVASKPTCGEYTFGRDDAYVEEFKTLGFGQDEGEIGIARSQFGPHIILTVEKTDEETLFYEDVSEDIREFLKNQEGQAQFESFYAELSADSEIDIKFEEL